MISDWSKYPSFTETEMACKCGCGSADMDEEFMSLLQSLRNAYAKPMIVSSAFRCADHNERVSSSGRDGPHTTGKAVDIAIDRQDALALLKLAALHPFTGFGIAQKGQGRFLHLDTLSEKEATERNTIRPTIWSY